MHILQTKCALQQKYKCKCDRPNASTSSKICALQQKCKCKYDPKCASQNLHLNENTHLIQDVICTKMHISAKISVHFSQDTNANKKANVCSKYNLNLDAGYASR